MSHSVSATAKTAIYAQETAEAFLTTLKISHSSLATAIRVVNDYSNITSQGNEFQGFIFEVTKPDDSESQLPTAKISIDNVDRQIVEAVRTLTGPALTEMAIILASSPDTIERGPWNLKLRNVDYDAMTVTGDLTSDDIYNERYPGKRITPANFPGLFP